MSSRGVRRLEIARKLASLPEGSDVMEYIGGLPYKDREHLRGLVDWVEEYERHDKG